MRLFFNYTQDKNSIDFRIKFKKKLKTFYFITVNESFFFLLNFRVKQFSLTVANILQWIWN